MIARPAHRTQLPSVRTCRPSVDRSGVAIVPPPARSVFAGSHRRTDLAEPDDRSLPHDHAAPRAAFVLRQDSTSDVAHSCVGCSRFRHRQAYGYAFQWFALAATLAFFYVVTHSDVNDPARHKRSCVWLILVVCAAPSQCRTSLSISGTALASTTRADARASRFRTPGSNRSTGGPFPMDRAQGNGCCSSSTVEAARAAAQSSSTRGRCASPRVSEASASCASASDQGGRPTQRCSPASGAARAAYEGERDRRSTAGGLVRRRSRLCGRSSVHLCAFSARCRSAPHAERRSATVAPFKMEMKRFYRILVVFTTCFSFAVIVAGAYVRLVDAGRLPRLARCYAAMTSASGAAHRGSRCGSGRRARPGVAHQSVERMFHRISREHSTSSLERSRSSGDSPARS